MNLHFEMTSPATLTFLLLLIHNAGGYKLTSSMRDIRKPLVPMDPLAATMAAAGMVHGLLEVQTRREGGFYEEKYKKLFDQNQTSNQMVKECIGWCARMKILTAHRILASNKP